MTKFFIISSIGLASLLACKRETGSQTKSDDIPVQRSWIEQSVSEINGIENDLNAFLGPDFLYSFFYGVRAAVGAETDESRRQIRKREFVESKQELAKAVTDKIDRIIPVLISLLSDQRPPTTEEDPRVATAKIANAQSLAFQLKGIIQGHFTPSLSALADSFLSRDNYNPNFTDPNTPDPILPAQFLNGQKMAVTKTHELVAELKSWLEEQADDDDEPVSAYEGCGIERFSQCRWTPSSAWLAAGNASDRPCNTDTTPYCQVEYRAMRQLLNQWLSEIDSETEARLGRLDHPLTIKVVKTPASSRYPFVYANDTNHITAPLSMLSTQAREEWKRVFKLAIGVRGAGVDIPSVNPPPESVFRQGYETIGHIPLDSDASRVNSDLGGKELSGLSLKASGGSWIIRRGSRLRWRDNQRVVSLNPIKVRPTGGSPFTIRSGYYTHQGRRHNITLPVQMPPDSVVDMIVEFPRQKVDRLKFSISGRDRGGGNLLIKGYSYYERVYPTITLTANGSTGDARNLVDVASGARVEIRWATTGFTSCELSDNVTVPHSLSGRFTKQADRTEIFKIECTTSSGQKYSRRVGVKLRLQ